MGSTSRAANCYSQQFGSNFAGITGGRRSVALTRDIEHTAALAEFVECRLQQPDRFRRQLRDNRRIDALQSGTAILAFRSGNRQWRARNVRLAQELRELIVSLAI